MNIRTIFYTALITFIVITFAHADFFGPLTGGGTNAPPGFTGGEVQEGPHRFKIDSTNYLLIDSTNKLRIDGAS